MKPLLKSNGGRRGAPAREDLPPAPRAERAPPGPPPTIGDLRRQGMTHVTLTCVEITCRHNARLSFNDLAMPDDTLFPDIGRAAKFVCTRCGRRKVEPMPCWDTVKAHGKPEH